MASIKRRADRGNRWEVRYRDPDGRQRARLFDRRSTPISSSPAPSTPS